MAAIGPKSSPNHGFKQELNRAVEFAWKIALQQLAAGSPEIVLPINSHEDLGEEGIALIAERYGRFFNHGVPSVFCDTNAQAIRILPPPQTVCSTMGNETRETASSSTQNSHPNRAKKAKERIAKVPRPPNAFILYRQHYHPKVLKENPNFHNTQISIIIGQMWKNEIESVKDHFKQQAESIKRKHEIDHPNYQYQPRKPSERKKRASKRKAETSPEIVDQTSSPDPSQSVNAAPCSLEFDADLNFNHFISFEDQPTQQAQPLTMIDDGNLMRIDYNVGQFSELQEMLIQHNNQPGLSPCTNGPGFAITSRPEDQTNFAEAGKFVYEPIGFDGTTPLELAEDILTRENVEQQISEERRQRREEKRQIKNPSLKRLKPGTKVFDNALAAISTNLHRRQMRILQEMEAAAASNESHSTPHQGHIVNLAGPNHSPSISASPVAPNNGSQNARNETSSIEVNENNYTSSQFQDQTFGTDTGSSIDNESYNAVDYGYEDHLFDAEFDALINADGQSNNLDNSDPKI